MLNPDLKNRIIVYFKTGVQRNTLKNAAATITSSKIAALLNNYGLTSANINASFPDFNEADTVNAALGEVSRQMNRAKVFTIKVPDGAIKKALITALNNLPEVLYAETDGETVAGVIPSDTRFGEQWNLRNTVSPGRDIHAEAAWNIFTGNPNAIFRGT